MPRTLSLLAVALCAAALPLAEPQRCRAAGPSAHEQQIEKTLGTPTQLEFVETPLQDVVQYLKDFHGIEIQIDKKALDGVGLDPSTIPITKQLQGLSLRSALNLVLRDHELTYLVADEVLLITTLDDAAGRLTTRLYPVADLIASGDRGEEDRRRDELIEAISSGIEPTTWRWEGGPGSIAATSLHGAATLVVSQTYHVHRKVAAFLEEQRSVVRAERLAAVPRCPVVDVHQTPAAERIEKVLGEPTEFQFVEETLQGVLDHLKQKHKIEIQVDRKALDDVGLDAKTIPITKNVKGISLRSALKLLLRDLDLTYVIGDDILLITTPEEAEIRLTTKIYAVGDLVGSSGFATVAVQRGLGMAGVAVVPNQDSEGPATGGGHAALVPGPATSEVSSGSEALIDLVIAIVEPCSWDHVGGPGSITGASLCGVDMLVVSQTQEVHEQIGRLLEKLREAVRGNRPAAALGDRPADKPVDKPVDKPADKPAAAPADDPLGERPAGKPIEEPASRPPDDPFAEAPPTASR